MADLRVRWHLELVDQASSRLLRQDRAIRTSLQQTATAQRKLETQSGQTSRAQARGASTVASALQREGRAAGATANDVRRLNSAQAQALSAGSRLAGTASRTADAYRRQAGAANQLSRAERARAAAQRASAGVAQGAARTGAGITAGPQRLMAAAAGGGIAATAVATFAGFEQQMSRVQAVSGATGDQLRAMTEQAKTLGADTSFSARQAADGMFQLSTAGFKTNEVMRAIPGTLDLAAASGTDLASAAELQATALRGFGLGASEAGRVADALATTVNRSAVEMFDLQDSLKYIAPVARATGQSMESMLAAVGLMGNVGVKGSQAGTTLRTALVRLTAPTEKSRDALGELGIKAGELRGPKGLLPLPEIMRKITTGAQGVDKGTRNAALAAIFGREALSGMVAMVEAGPDALDRNIRALQRSEGQAKRTATVMRDNVSGAWDTFTGSLETGAITLTERWGPALRDTLKGAAGVVNDLAESLGELGTGIGRGAAGEPAAGPRRGGPPVPDLHPQHRGRLRDQPRAPRLIPELPRGARDPEQAEREETRRRTPRFIRAPRSAVVQRNLGQPRAPALGGARDEDRTPLIRRVGAALGGALSTAAKAAQDAGKQLLDAFKPALPFFQNVLLPLLQGFGRGVLSSIVGAFKVAVPIIRIVATVLGVVGRAAKPLAPVFRGIGTVIGFFATGPILKAVSTLGQVGKVMGVVRLAARVLYAPIRLVGSVFGTIGRAVGGAVSAIARFVGRAASTGARITSALAGAIGGLPGRLLGFAVRAGTGFVRGIRGAIGGVRSAGRSIANGLLSFVTGLPGRLGNVASSIAQAFVGLGKRLVRAVVDGVKSAPGVVLDAVKSLVPGPLRGAVADLFGGRGGGVVRRQTGGLIPSAVSPGELVQYGGASWTVPGSRTAADSVFAMLPAGAAVYTESGQQMLAAGMHPGQVLSSQLPHFQRGGVVPFRGGGIADARVVRAAARRAHFSLPSILWGVYGAESNFGRNLGPSAAGARGPFQLMPGTAAGLGVNPGDFAQAAWGAARYLGRYVSRGVEGMLAAYNAGPARRKPWPAETQAYIPKVRRLGRSYPYRAGDDAGGGGGGTEETTVKVPVVLGRSRTRAGLLPDSFAQGRTAGAAGLTRAEIAAAGRGVAGARVNPILDAIRQAQTATTRELTIPGVEGANVAGARGMTPRMRNMAAFAARASKRWPRYHYGGGHGSFTGPYDCSGFASAILHAGGFLGRPMSTDGFKVWGQAGSGRRITVGVRGSTGRAAHMMTKIGNTYWEAGGRGVGRRTGWSGNFPIKRHPAGYRRGGIIGGLAGLPARVRAILAADPTALDPRSPNFVGEGLRAGGIVGLQGGGVIGAGLGPAIRGGVAAAMTNAGGSLAALDAILGDAIETRLLALRRQLVAAVRRGGSKRTVQRLQGLVDLVDSELGRRVGELERQIATRARTVERGRGAMERHARRAGIDPESAAGLQGAIVTSGLEELAARATVGDARAALNRAKRAGAGRETLDELQTGLDDARDALDEVLVAQVERRRAFIRAQAQETVDRAQFSLDLGQGAQAGLETALRAGGVGDTAFGMRTRAAGIRANVIPGLQGLIGAQQGQLAAAISTGDVAGQRAASLAIQASTNDLASAIQDAADLIRDAAVRAAQDVADVATHRTTLASTGLQRLELEQRLAGTFEAGGQARAGFITAQVIPSLQAEVAAIVEQERVYREQGMGAELRAAIEAEAAKRNEILQAQLDAQELIADNTDPRKFGGSLGIGNGLTDDLIRAGLGA